MKNYLIKGFLCVMVIGLLSACTPDISPNTYDVNTIGQTQRVQYGKIVQASPVKVRANNDQTGTLVGAGTGALAGSYIGGDTRMNLLGALGGAVIGGIAGKQIGSRMGNQMAMQYIVKLRNGHTLSVIQGGPALAIGQKVMVLTGGAANARIEPVYQ